VAEDLRHDRRRGYQLRLEYGDKDYDLWMRLNLTISAILKARIPDMADSGLSYAEYAVLGMIEWLGGSAIPAELARWLMRRPQSISELITRMEGRGLVKRTRSAENKKIRKVVLLPKGREALRRTVERDPIHSVMRLPEDEYRQLWLLLERLTAQSLAHVRREAGPPSL
jgi:DNA-binding MarR family transcriptional regulator